LGVFKDWVNMVVDGDGSPVRVARVPGRKAEKQRLFQLSTDAKRQVTHRANDVSATCDIGRAHRCPVTKKGNNVMEDWMHLLEWGVLAAFRGMHESHAHVMSCTCVMKWTTDNVWCDAGDELHPIAAQMLGKLRCALLYFMRPEGERVMDAAGSLEEAQEALLEYCMLADTYTRKKLCKYNLHVLLCRLAEQEECRGGAASCSELWVERVVQFGKSSVR
jgi:hypothetical protein